MKPYEERWTAWIEGDLSGADLAEMERELAAKPELAKERNDALKLRALLREDSAALQLANTDFFNLQLLQRIEAEQPKQKASPEEKAALAWFSSTLMRMAWAGAACLLLAGVLFKTMIPAGSTAPERGVAGGSSGSEKAAYFAQVVETWPGDPSISATTVYNSVDNVTVLWLDGLDYIPADHQLQ